MNLPKTNKPRIVIIGGGFAGMNLAKNLKSVNAQVVLVDKNNFHTFQPLLYQVATAGLEPDSVTYPLRKIFNNYDDFYFRVAEAQEVDTEREVLITNRGEIEYDYLVLSTGAETNFFGNENVARYSMPMKSISEALDLRSLILQNFEEALLTNDVSEREKFMNLVIVGGGPTGVELAGALAELKKLVLPKDYPDLDFRRMQVHLIEGTSALLNTMSSNASEGALDFLENMGVQVWLDSMVKDYDGEEVQIGNKTLPSKTLIWAAGVKGAPPKGIKAGKSGRLTTDEFLMVDGYPNIFSIGDLASIESEEKPNGHPMLASVAVQQGEHLARNFKLLLSGKALKPFEYNDKGTMATVGRNKAVVDLPHYKFQGRMAWYVWMFVHLLLLVGFRNKLVALLNWIWSYVNYDKGIRLIIRPFKRKQKRELVK
ncbi:MAG: NAD(P)/FAD-dependent oxidoreductase [Cyclobacteriaceae bacterium]